MIVAIRCGTRRSCPGSATGLGYLYLATRKKNKFPCHSQVDLVLPEQFLQARADSVEFEVCKLKNFHFYVDFVYDLPGKTATGAQVCLSSCRSGLTEHDDPCPEH